VKTVIERTITRRDTLKLLAGAGIAAGLGQAFAASAPGAILKRPIPKTGEMLPALGLGTYRAFDVGSTADERASVREVLELFAQMGGTVVDSSPMYGNAEEVVGDLAAELGIAELLFMATKVWTTGRDAGMRQMQASMRKMRSNPMELMQIHNLVDWRTHIDTLRQWKEEGRIRYLGVTHYTTGSYNELEQLIKTQNLDFVQFNFSIATREAEKRLLPLAALHQVATIINRPFEQGRLFRATKGKPLPGFATEFDCHSWAQFFLKYVLSSPGVTCPIPATSNPKHLVDNMQAGFGLLPDKSTRRKMVEVIQQL